MTDITQGNEMQLVMKIYSLPYHIRLNMFKELALTRKHDEDLDDGTLNDAYFERAVKMKKVAQMWKWLENHEKENKPAVPQPRKEGSTAPKYKRTPALVEATQFSRTEPLPEGVQAMRHHEEYLLKTGRGTKVWIQDGDWIITHPNGDRTVCNDYEFKEAYIPVEGD